MILEKKCCDLLETHLLSNCMYRQIGVVHTLNSVVGNILAARHCAMSESGHKTETVDRHGSDQSVINKLLALTEI
jgi:hypothetical protein